MTFQDLIKHFYDNPDDCFNPCESFDCIYDAFVDGCDSCLYKKLILFALKELNKSEEV